MLRGIQSSDSVHKQKPSINHIRDSKSAELCVNIYLEYVGWAFNSRRPYHNSKDMNII